MFPEFVALLHNLKISSNFVGVTGHKQVVWIRISTLGDSSSISS